MKPTFTRRSLVSFLALVCFSSWLVTEASLTNSIVLDEFAHMPAGLGHLDLGNFGLYRESPPLVQAMIALPVWVSGAKRNYDNLNTNRRSEWAVGQDFINANDDSFELYYKSRFVVLCFFVSCAVLIFWWAAELYDDKTAALCAALWLLEPSLIAHSSIATVDIGTAFFALAAVYACWKFTRSPGWPSIVAAGIALGLAQASKFSMLTLYPAFIGYSISPWGRCLLAVAAPRSPGLPSWAKVALVVAISLVVLNGCYGFHRSGKSLGSFRFRSHMLTGLPATNVDEVPVGNRFQGTFLAAFRVPLPADYLRGLDSQKWEEEIGFFHLSAGRLVHGGSWYSPMQTLWAKLPGGTLLLLILTAPWLAVRWRSNADIRLLLVTLAVFGLFLSQQTGLNWVFRYMIPFMPIAIVCVGAFINQACAIPHARAKIAVRCLLASVIIGNGIGVVSIRPSYFTYGNFLVGGASGAQSRFLGSDYDWGQDLRRLRYWSAQHPAINPLILSYFGVLETSALGFEKRELPLSLLLSATPGADDARPKTTRNFYWAISSNMLNGVPNWFNFEGGLRVYCSLNRNTFNTKNSIAQVGNTMFIFKIEDFRLIVPPNSVVDAPSIAGCLRKIDESHELNFMGVP